MTNTRTSKKATPILAPAGVSEAPEHDPTDPEQNPDDVTLPWSKAWVAARMARNDGRYVRVHDEGADCCAGLMCIHYVNTARQKVRGKGAPKSLGVAVSLEDATVRVTGLLKSLGRFN